MIRKRIFIIGLFSLPVVLHAQTGGDNVYEFLNLTHSGLVSSLGGANVSLSTGNLNLSWHNPSLLDSGMNDAAALNYVNYFAGVNYGSALYSRTYEGAGNFAAGLTYLNYGSFTQADPSGNITGNFYASEYAFSLIWSGTIDSLFSIGINLKPVLSHLERYTSAGIAVDLGGSYRSRSGLFSAGFVIRNAGVQITRYAGEKRQKLPFEIQAGLSQKLAHAPLRISLTIRHLEKYDLTHHYTDTTDDADNTNTSEFLENLMRHAVIGVEVLPHRNFYLSAGYNYQRRRELSIDSRVSASGFSWGFGINTSFLCLEFGRAAYHMAGSSNHVSLIVRPGMLYSRLRK
jgi:hypothetical protein